MPGQRFPQGPGRGGGSSGRRAQGEKRKRGFTEDISTSEDLEARRDAFRQQSKLLVPLDEAESRVYQGSPPTKVTLPEKNKDDVFANLNLDKPSTIDVASDDVNWYSINKERPGHAPGYLAKVVAADPDAVAALAATMIKLAKENNSNVVLAWLEFPGKAAGASPSENPKLSNDRAVSPTKEPGFSVDSEASRPKKPKLSHGLNASQPPPVDVASKSDQVVCANCQYTGHTLAQCPKPSNQGNVGGCPLHNTKLHSLDNCDTYAGRSLQSLRDDEVLDIYKVQVVDRSNLPPIRSERFFWLDCLGEAVKRNLSISGNDVDKSAALELPWTHEHTRMVAALEPNDPQLHGFSTPLELCSTKVADPFWYYLPTDPFWHNKTVAAVAAEHAQGKLEYLRPAAHTKPKSKAVAARTLGSSAPPKGGRPATPAPNGPGLTENDKRNIKIDLRKELGVNGLLNERGTILLPEEVRAMALVNSPDGDTGFDAGNGNSGRAKILSFDTVRRVVASYRRCEINERHWDRHCPVQRLLFDMVAETRSFLAFHPRMSSGH